MNPLNIFEKEIIIEEKIEDTASQIKKKKWNANYQKRSEYYKKKQQENYNKKSIAKNEIKSFFENMSQELIPGEYEYSIKNKRSKKSKTSKIKVSVTIKYIKHESKKR